MVSRRAALIGGGALAVTGAAAAYGIARDMGSLQQYEASVAATRAAIRQTPELRELIRYATLAPSGHNTQPWSFRAAMDRVDILPDVSRRTPVVDPDDHHLFVSLGCAAENLALAFAAAGQAGDLRFDPAGNGSVVFTPGRAAADQSALFAAIPRRQSSRTDYDGRPVASADVPTLTAIAAIPGVDLVLLTDRPRINRVRDLVLAGNSAQLTDKDFMRELKAWLRFSPRQAIRTADGLFTATTGNPILPDWLGPRLFDFFINRDTQNAKYARQIDSSSGIAVFCAQSPDPMHWVLAGRASQRFALQATALGLQHAFINQPVEVASLRPALADIIGLPGRRPDLVMRFGHGPTLPFSARRPAENVILATPPEVLPHHALPPET